MSKPKKCPVCKQYEDCDVTIHRLVEDGILEDWFNSKIKTFESQHARRNLPRKVFFWTLPQIADILGMSYHGVYCYVWKEGKEKYAWEPRLLKAVDISKTDTSVPMWRVEEEELIRWLKHRRIRIYK